MGWMGYRNFCQYLSDPITYFLFLELSIIEHFLLNNAQKKLNENIKYLVFY